MPTQIYLETLINQTNQLSDSMKESAENWLEPYLLVTKAVNWINYSCPKPPEDVKEENQYISGLCLAFEITNNQGDEILLLQCLVQFIGAVSRESNTPMSKVCYELIKVLMNRDGFMQALDVVSSPNDAGEKTTINLTDLIVSVQSRDD